jgi:UDP-3-O-[3-hydroxymyristoyl] glucosamine N-acyltransferase
MSLATYRPTSTPKLSTHAARQNVQTAVDNLNAAMAAQRQAETDEQSRKSWDDAQDRKAAAIIRKNAAQRNENTRTSDRAWLLSNRPHFGLP